MTDYNPRLVEWCRRMKKVVEQQAETMAHQVEVMRQMADTSKDCAQAFQSVLDTIDGDGLGQAIIDACDEIEKEEV